MSNILAVVQEPTGPKGINMNLIIIAAIVVILILIISTLLENSSRK